MTKVQIDFWLEIPLHLRVRDLKKGGTAVVPALETAYSDAQLDKLARSKGFEPHDD